MAPVTAGEAAGWRFERAPAKVNLGLRILGRRGDGFHLLDSLVVFASYGDVVALRPTSRSESQLCMRGPFAAALAGEHGNNHENNLALRAAVEYRAAFGGPNVDIVLWKRLPIAAGIGGGSADAAAMLRLLQRLQVRDERPSMAALYSLAANLGADMPMCLAGAPVRVGGIGEALAPLPGLPSAFAVLVNPGVACATPAVFKAYDGAFSKSADPIPALASASDLAATARAFGNDLEAAAVSIAPAIRACLAALAQSPGLLAHGMSGSGATCFALYNSRQAARSAANFMARNRPEWWVRACKFHGSDKTA